MMAAEVLAALDLPAAARVDRRVPKTTLVEHGAPTAADKRRIGDGIDQLVWVAALKPTTVGVAEYRDGVREYLEIAVLHLTLRAAAKVDRLVELLHRAVPYPVVAVAEQGDRAQLSLAHKRWSQGEAGKTVLDGEVVAVDPAEVDAPTRTAFLAALALGRQPRGTLFALYQGWMDTLLALHAARRTNAFAIPDAADARAARREALGECERLEAEIALLCAAAAKEKQIRKQVELNLELKRLEAARAAAVERL
ncbi:DUF4391 domain-containing protein [bacterium]|nr:DUF4391 domain-containing protein [bacterium]